MGIKKNTENIFQYFKNRKSFTTNDVYSFFSQDEPDIKRATVNWRIYELARQGFFKRIGRGTYVLGKEIGFSPTLSKKHKIMFSRIKKQFPLIAFCCWHTSALKEFFQHLAENDFLLVEVEREAMDAVFHFVKETNKNTFKEPSRDAMENYVFDGKDAVIVKPLISEAPLQDVDNITVPTIEKILVDLVADSEVLFFLQGNEILNIFGNAMEKFTI
ncbi:MAG: hypothetical protein C0399_01265, partial [Syntrophus sp. (in: bacteria)]|nr:hypothetical protein [Syntrophus sp. (in: bacteria)]